MAASRTCDFWLWVQYHNHFTTHHTSLQIKVNCRAPLAGCSSPFPRPLSPWVGIPLSLWHMASAMPDLRLPFQPQSITALWPVSNYTAWWQETCMWATCPGSLRESGTAGVKPASPTITTPYATVQYTGDTGISFIQCRYWYITCRWR